MAVEVGKRYYIMLHAYHHFIAEVVEVTGKREAVFTNVWRIHSCSRRGWQEFFAQGIKDDTVKAKFPDGEMAGWMAAFEWVHPMPKE